MKTALILLIACLAVGCGRPTKMQSIAPAQTNAPSRVSLFGELDNTRICWDVEWPTIPPRVVTVHREVPRNIFTEIFKDRPVKVSKRLIIGAETIN